MEILFGTNTVGMIFTGAVELVLLHIRTLVSSEVNILLPPFSFSTSELGPRTDLGRPYLAIAGIQLNFTQLADLTQSLNPQECT